MADKYAEGLRSSLIADLFDGEDVDLEAEAEAGGATEGGGAFTVEDYIGSTTDALQDVAADLDEFADHEFIKGAGRGGGLGEDAPGAWGTAVGIDAWANRGWAGGRVAVGPWKVVHGRAPRWRQETPWTPTDRCNGHITCACGRRRGRVG